MAFLLPAFIAFDTARSCIAFGVIRYGVYLPPAKIAFLAETLKLVCALAFHFRWHKNNTRVPNPAIPSSWLQSLLPRSTGDGKVDYQICFYTALPAALYLINNVFYLVGLRFVSPALLNTAMLAKLPLTAVLHYLIMKRARCRSAWISLGLLSISVLSLHFPWESIGDALWPNMSGATAGATIEPVEGAGSIMAWLGPLLGFVIAGISSVTAIATEILLKKPMPFWSLQIWLYGWGALFAAIMVMAGVDRPASESHNPDAQINENMGYMAVVITTCATGLVVANILRKSDNLVKLVGSSATIVTTLLLQPLLDPSLWSETCNPATVIAVGMIAMTTWTYNYYKDQPVGSQYIELPMHTPKEKIMSPDMSMEQLPSERLDVYHDEEDVQATSSSKKQPSQQQSSDWLTPTKPKLIQFGLGVLLVAALTQIFAKPHDMRRRMGKYNVLAGIKFASWNDKPTNLDCIREWQVETNVTALTSKFSEWDRRYLRQTKCPIYPIADEGYIFHMLWLGPLSNNLAKSIQLTIDAWLATQRLQDGHQMYFWYDQPVTQLFDAYANYTDFISFRHFDRKEEAVGTCLSSMREYGDESYQDELSMPPQTRSDLVRVLLLSKYGGVWLDTDSIPMRDLTPLFRVGPFSPSLYDWMWNNNVLFFGPPGSATGKAVLETTCSMPYEETAFRAKYPDINPAHWYWLYNDGLLRVCDKYTGCGVQRLPIGLFDADVASWNRPGQKEVHLYATEADNHSLLPGDVIPIGFREMFVWHGRGNQHPDAFNPQVNTALRALRHRIDELLEMGPSFTGQDLFPGPGLIE